MLTRRQFLKICIATAMTTSIFEIMANKATRRSEASFREIPVLLYHRVGYTKGYLTVSPERFDADLAELSRNGYSAIGLGQFEQYLVDGDVELPEKPVLITFDDGYLDNYEHAFPILRKHNMTAVFYIITGLIGYPDRLAAEHILKMADGGMYFGSHTVSHRSLGELSAKEERDELIKSKYALEDILGYSVRTIAYPKGSYNDETLRIAEELGYVGGFTTRHGKCTRKSHHFVLRRIPVFSYDGEIATVIARRGRPE